jgi:predicted transcriptional regulator
MAKPTLDREKQRDAILRGANYMSGEAFKTAFIASTLNVSVSQARYLLNGLVVDGLLVKTVLKAKQGQPMQGVVVYRRRTSNQLSTKWRTKSNHEIGIQKSTMLGAL